MKRNLLLLTALAFLATPLLADNPSARYETRMVYDPTTTHVILFGGLTASDAGTKKAYHLNDTWDFNGFRWIPRFPAHSPGPRSGHVMVYDTNRSHIVLFGGRDDTTDLNDTWVFEGKDWKQINTPNSPPGRILAGGAYDPVRDRLIIYGGTQTSADGKTSTALHDTWEFDGTTWTKIGGDGPSITKPILVYDAARDQVLMMGMDDKIATHMYAYDAANGTWNELKPSTLPSCVNEGVMTYQAADQTVLYTGGVCATSSATDETYTWDGTNWTKVDLVTAATRVFGGTLVYSDQLQSSILFGGTPLLGLPTADLWIYAAKTWLPIGDDTRPGPRSLFTFTSDPVNNTIWMFGGINESTALSDFWQYQNGDWRLVTAANAPVGCNYPNASFDTDRQKLVVVCTTSQTFEWDGTAWKTFENLKSPPPARRFSSMVYDQNLKKTVLFGGYDGSNYLDQTWLWDGTSWSQQKHNPPTSRSLTAMWYDATLKKTVIYGGLGRLTSQDRLTRYEDMWTFDGNGWTALKPSGPTPGLRYGATIAVDPRNNHTILFGGLRVDTVPPTPPATEPQQIQVYAGDQWEWDGSGWTQVAASNIPPARENAGLAFDPTRNEMVMFGGWAGRYMSDLWVYNPTAWHLRILDPEGGRRRVVH